MFNTYVGVSPINISSMLKRKGEEMSGQYCKKILHCRQQCKKATAFVPVKVFGATLIFAKKEPTSKYLAALKNFTGGKQSSFCSFAVAV